MDTLTDLQKSFEEFDAQVKADATATPPAEWKLIPTQPTQEMLIALMSEGEKDAMKGFPQQFADRFLSAAKIQDRYLRLLAAAPFPAPEQQEPLALPFAILPDEMAALRRFHECSQDGDEYDVAKPMMKRLAEIGLVRRVTGSIYEYTTFGLSVLIGDFSDSPNYADVSRAAEESRQYAQALEHRIKDQTVTNHILLGQRDTALADAARYRWLRDNNTGPSMIDRVCDDCNPPYLTLKCGADLDSAIDAAKKGGA